MPFKARSGTKVRQEDVRAFHDFTQWMCNVVEVVSLLASCQTYNDYVNKKQKLKFALSSSQDIQ